MPMPRREMALTRTLHTTLESGDAGRGTHARTTANDRDLATPQAGKDPTSKLLTTPGRSERRALQTLDANRQPGDGESNAGPIKPPPQQHQQQQQQRSGLKRKHHRTSEATAAPPKAHGAAMKTTTREPPSGKTKTPTLDDAELQTIDREQLQRENLAWLDMLVALLERKYGAYQLPVCIADLEKAGMLDRHWRRSASGPATAEDDGLLTRSGPPSSSTKGDADREREERRALALRRHAQQIQDASVSSTTSCGCKTGCLKMYCVCFSTRGFCHESCNCDNCKNSRDNVEQRVEAIQNYLSNDPRAFSFAPQHTATTSGFLQLLPQKSSSVVLRGCRCKKSKCQKKYCECFQNGLGCTPHCRCVDCANDSSTSARQLRAKTKAEKSASSATTHHIHVSVTKKPRRNYVQKTVRLRL